MNGFPSTRRIVWTVLLVLGTVGLVLAGRPGPVHGQSSDATTIEAVADPNPVGVGEPLTFTLRIEGAALADVDPPEPPRTEGLTLQQPTPATQHDVSFANGQLTRRVTFRWTYEPLRTGTARIHPVRVAVRGRTYATEAIDVEVVSQAQRRQPSSRTAPGTTRRRSNPAPDPPQASLIDSEDLFIRVEPSTDRVYQNEQLTVTYHLFFRDGIQLRHSRLANAWDAPGFWREELDVDTRPVPRTVTLDGERYQTIVLKRAALFPTRPGSLQVDPLEIETEARVTSRLRGRVDPFFPQSYESIALASDPLRIRAEPLPDGAPAAFEGAVGDFRLRARVEPAEVQVGQPVRLRVRIEGTGNIATLQPPAFDPPNGFALHDPKEQTSIDRSGTRVRGTKTFTYVLVPHSGGSYTLTPPDFAYFDPDTRRYRTLQGEPTDVRVRGDEAPNLAGSDDDRLPADAVAPIMTEASSWRRTDGRPLHQTPWPYVAVLAPLLLAGGLALLRRSLHASADPAAPASTASRLEQARRAMRDRQPEACYNAIEHAVLGFIGDRLGVAAPGLTRLQLDAHLERHGVPQRAREALYELLDVCDQVRYSPARSSEEAMQSAIRRAEQLIDYLDPKLS